MAATTTFSISSATVAHPTGAATLTLDPDRAVVYSRFKDVIDSLYE